MAKIRVLVVDDSAVVRRVVSDVLSADPDLEVVGTAPDGRVALLKIAHRNPDVVTLDVEMPEMDGLEVLSTLRRERPELPVIMLSSLTERGAEVTLDCLHRGATDYVMKPSGVLTPQETADRLRADLIPRIKLFARRPSPPPAPRVPAVPGPAPRPRPQRVDLVVVGASTGGPKALPELLSVLTESFPVPILVVQHMPPVFTKTFAERLDGLLRLRVRQAASGELLRGGCVRIAPGDFHLEVRREGPEFRLLVHDGPMENSCRPSVDPLFRSAARACGPAALGIVMTGMGRDGLAGSRDLRAAGGAVLAQDAASSSIWGMPGAVAEAGLADALLSPAELGAEVVRRVQAFRGLPPGGAKP
jgi:two-component system chemotaxis response regulator CheB